MTELEVDCVQRTWPRAGHHRITHLGHRGFACRMPVELAIMRIRGEVSRFYILDPGTVRRVYIEVRRETGKCPYLQARLDGDWTGHLAALPECRPGYREIREASAPESRQSVRFSMPR